MLHTGRSYKDLIAICETRTFNPPGSALVSATSEFARRIHPPPWMPWVIYVEYVDFSVTFEADRDCVSDLVASFLIDMIRFDFETAKTVADATTALASYEEIFHLVSIELAGHGFDYAKFR